jgi:WASH complex subunit strumpellin
MGDYVNMDGLRIWHHDYNRVMCFLQEQEANHFLKKKILAWQSEYQSKVAPIELPRQSSSFVTCLGSLTYGVVEMTRHEASTYCAITGGWLNLQTGEEIIGTKAISRICAAIGVEGTSAIDTILSFLLAEKLKSFFALFAKGRFGNLSTVMQQLLTLWPLPPQTYDAYGIVAEQLKSTAHDWTVLICKIGQVQLLKATIDAHMKLKCELEAQALNFMLGTANSTVLQAIKQFYRDPTHNPYPSSRLIGALSAYLENSGNCVPLEKIYKGARALPEVSLILFGLTLINLSNQKLREDERLHMLVRPEYYGHYEFIVGAITILRQLNVQHTYAFLTFLGQYANMLLAVPMPGAKKEIAGGIEITRLLKNVMIFVKDYGELSKTPRRMIDTFVSPTIFDFISI